MNIYQAIMKAADSIERAPHLFDFHETVPVPDCGTPGCALGWIALHADMPTFENHGKIYWEHWQMAQAMGIPDGYPDSKFYDRMNALSRDWTVSATECSAALRLYATKYHGDDKPIERALPADVLAIFEPTKVAA